MTRNFAKTLMLLGLTAGCVSAYAQTTDPPPPFGWTICYTPPTPLSPDYSMNTRANNLFRLSVGGSGTVTYFGTSSGCPAITQSHTYNVAGRIGFGSGPVGSIQDDNSTGPFDNDMMYTFGMPINPGGDWSYAVTRRLDPATGTETSSLFGTTVTGAFFAGASGRYIHIENVSDNIDTVARCDVLGDGGRIRWEMTNLSTTAQDLGLWYGAMMGELLSDLVDVTGFNPIDGAMRESYVNVPGHKPLVVDTRIKRADDPANFPPYIQLCYGQTHAYGLQVDFGPTDSTTDSNGQSDATQVDEYVVGLPPFVLGDPVNGNNVNNPPDFIFGDVPLAGDPTQFLIKYYPQTGGPIVPNATRTVVSYFRDTWGNAKYIRTDINGVPLNEQPYSSVVDAPHILVQDDSGAGTNGLGNNPFTIRVYIDNVGGYSRVYTGVPINDVRVTLNLPAGMSFVNGDSSVKELFQVAAGENAWVDFQVQSDGIVIGDLPYTVTITSTPGPSDNKPITMNGTIRVSATKQIPLEPGANLISAPWVFTDSSWEAVLGLTTPDQFTAYEWDPQQNGYVLSTAASRGKGVWLILNPDVFTDQTVVPYNNASSPTDMISGAPNIQLKSGWNLIGDPYPYAIPVSQLVGVPASNPAQSFSWKDLITQNIVSPYLAYWDTSIQNYRYVQGISAMIQPNQGYWVKVQTAQDLTLNFPPVYDTFVPGGRASGPTWVQTANHWRLQLKAQSNGSQDVDNFVGVATSDTQSLQVPKPPQGPVQSVSVAIDGAIAGLRDQLAQAFSDHNGNLQYRVYVKAGASGPLTLSWPNMSTLPRNIGFRIVDAQTHQSIDMRSHPSLTFTATQGSTRTFVVQSSTSGSTQPIIGTTSSTSGRLSSRTPATLTYRLNYNATVSIRVLNSAGNQVALLQDTANRSQGSNNSVWNLRNSSGNYVPVGNYQFQIDATADGDNARKVVNVTVSR